MPFRQTRIFGKRTFCLRKRTLAALQERFPAALLFCLTAIHPHKSACCCRRKQRLGAPSFLLTAPRAPEHYRNPLPAKESKEKSPYQARLQRSAQLFLLEKSKKS